MTARRMLRRLVSFAALAAFLAGAGGDVYGYHACPHHSPAAAPHGAAGARHSPSHGEGPAPCTCVGTCHATASAPVVVSPAVIVPAPRMDVPAIEVAASDAPRRRIVGRFLPYPNGPPAS